MKKSWADLDQSRRDRNWYEQGMLDGIAAERARLAPLVAAATRIDQSVWHGGWPDPGELKTLHDSLNTALREVEVKGMYT